MRTSLIIAAVWCTASVLFALGWGRFHRLMDYADMIAEAEHILYEAAK